MWGGQEGKSCPGKETRTVLPWKDNATDQGAREVGNLVQQLNANTMNRRRGTEPKGKRQIAVRRPQSEPRSSNGRTPVKDVLAGGFAKAA